MWQQSPAPARRLLALAAAATVLLFGASQSPAYAAPVTADQVHDRAAAIARAWIPKITANGSITDPLPITPVPFPDGYGELMLADVLAQHAQRSGDATSGQAAARIARGRTARGLPSDPFNLLAGAGLQTTLERAPVPGFDGDFGGWLAGYGSFKYDGKNGGACLMQAGCYNNWRLVWAAGAADLMGTKLNGPGGSLLADPSGTRAQLQGNTSLAVRNAGPLTWTPKGHARIISDPTGQPPAYHVLSSYLLERLSTAAPALESLGAAELRDHAGLYSLSLMAPDGQLSWAGRSLDQSWVMAAAASLGARNAARGGALAPAWRSYADRALERLAARYPALPDGTTPIVPGLRRTMTRKVIDNYAGMVQYNGLTAWLLADAAAFWPAPTDPRGKLPSEGSLMVSDPGGSDLVWGRAGKLFWSFGIGESATDGREAFGFALLKQQRGTRWSDALALRPQTGTRSRWVLRSKGRAATFRVSEVGGTSGRKVTLRGHWVRGKKKLRAGTVNLRARGTKLEASTSLRKGERLTLAVYTPSAKGKLRVRGPKSRARKGKCTISASGQACARGVSFSGAGTAVVSAG